MVVPAKKNILIALQKVGMHKKVKVSNNPYPNSPIHTHGNHTYMAILHTPHAYHHFPIPTDPFLLLLVSPMIPTSFILADFYPSYPLNLATITHSHPQNPSYPFLSPPIISLNTQHSTPNPINPLNLTTFPVGPTSKPIILTTQ